jgi:hypothetical protein
MQALLLHANALKMFAPSLNIGILHSSILNIILVVYERGGTEPTMMGICCCFSSPEQTGISNNCQTSRNRTKWDLLLVLVSENV